MRQALATLTLSALLAGCTVTTHGAAVPAPTLGHAPQPLSSGALPGLLLDSGEIGSIMDARLELVDSADSMYTNSPPADGCMIWAEAQDYVYRGSGWSAVQVQHLRDRADDPDHVAYQAVVSFPDALGAHDFYAGQVTGWSKCDNRQVNLQDPGGTEDHYFTFGKAAEDHGVLTVTRVQEGGRGWSCQRALTAKNNVVVDVSACAYDIGDRGARIATAVAAKVPEQ
jgi:hypothetical protein